MREFKFRAWDRNKEKMLGWEHLINNFEIGHIFAQQDLFKGQTVVESNYKIMQYTGIKDMEGREIYEGDILEYVYQHRERTGALYSIEYWSGQLIIGFYAKCLSSGDTEYLDNLGGWIVVGNIYESPELLEGE